MLEELQPEDPRSVGRYSLLGRLGEGGMGRVFLGRSRGLKLVAVKVIRPENAGEPGFRSRFAHEVQAARRVGGVYTAVVVDDDASGPVPWLATEYVAGPSLAEAVGKYGPLPVGSVLTLAAGLAEGLEEIHKAGVVHRDLKPSNVLLADDGPRIIDFGISRAAEATMVTQTGTVMGTPGFMSPEQASGGTVDRPSDVFSLGAVLAFAATGEGPFGMGSDMALLYRVIHNEPDTTRLPPQLRPLVQRCLAKDPADRPTTSGLLSELGEAQPAADWLPPSLAGTLSQYQPPTVTSTGRARDRTDGTPDGGQDERRRKNRRIWAAAIAAAAVIIGAVVYLILPPPPPPLASVPAVVGETLVAATSALKSSGFDDIPYLYNCYGSDNSGDVVRQSPAAGARVTQASPVHLYLQANNCYTVPDVIGMNLSDASDSLKSRRYDNFSYLYDCYGSANISDVVRQVPAAGARIVPTSPVHLYLQANDCHTVPDVIGMNLSNASYTLKQEGFTNIPWLYDCYGSNHLGAVVRQSPAAGTSYASNQPVSLKLQANNC
jgi:eukaryotic-like serine/threonine-protein kinase